MITHVLSLGTAVDGVPFTPCSKKAILYTEKLFQKSTSTIPAQLLMMKIKHSTQIEGRIRQRTQQKQTWEKNSNRYSDSSESQALLVHKPN